MNHKIDDIDKKNNFKVPEKYFEDLPLKIQTRIHKDEKKNQYAFPLWKLAVAASMLIFLVTYFIIEEQPTSADALLAEVSQEELIAYLDEIDIDLEEITSTFQETANDFDLDMVDAFESLEVDEEDLDELMLEFDLNEDYL